MVDERSKDSTAADATAVSNGANNNMIPYTYDTSKQVPPGALQIWEDVGKGLDKSQTVIWKSAVESLAAAHEFLTISPAARDFCETHMAAIVSILVDQHPHKTGPHERQCVQDSLSSSVLILALELDIQVKRSQQSGVGTRSKILEDVLCHLWDRKRPFFQGQRINKGWSPMHHHHHASGLPEVRLKLIENFRDMRGFMLLTQYLEQHVNSPSPPPSTPPNDSNAPTPAVSSSSIFPRYEVLYHVLQALCDMLPSPKALAATAKAARTPATANSVGPQMADIAANNGDGGGMEDEPMAPPQEKEMTVQELAEEDALAVTAEVMKYLSCLSDEALKKTPTEHLQGLQKGLQAIYDKLIVTRRSCTYAFYAFWRNLVLRLIRSPSLPLRLFGWEQMADLIDACNDHRPPPREFVVSQAGCAFVNGDYHFAAALTPDGYALPNLDITYVRTVPASAGPGAGKKLTLFRCTMRSQQKWWFLSEADEEQPGTDRDIDYYQHKSKEHEEAYPPRSQWITCRSAGIDPPPIIDPHGLLVPAGEELNTLEHQLAKWAIDNQIVEQVLGDTTIHREVVARSTVLVKFLAAMCDRDPPDTDDTPAGTQQPNQYCLQPSHLQFAWKTCTRKADAAVASQVYQLLVTILPRCPGSIAIPLLKDVQATLQASFEKPEYLAEVAEFLSALAANNAVDTKQASGSSLSDEVRTEVLRLLWSVLTHPEASQLKGYDALKSYVAHELRVESKGTEYRERFLHSCIDAMTKSIDQSLPLDEPQALRMVKLTLFVLEACPRQQAENIVLEPSVGLPQLVYRELVAYLERRQRGAGIFRKTSTNSLSQHNSSLSKTNSRLHTNAFNDRLRILRHIYGLSGPKPGRDNPVVLSEAMLERLWSLCSSYEDREAVVVFIAGASTMKKSPVLEIGNSVGTSVPVQAEVIQTTAFTSETVSSFFVKVLCSPDFDYADIGVHAFRSFVFLFLLLSQESRAPQASKSAALDALWRLCLTVKAEDVASMAMKELLSVYTAKPAIPDPYMASNGNASNYSFASDVENFGPRIFQILQQVKENLTNDLPASDLSVQRCLRVLNAAIGQPDGESLSITNSTLTRLQKLPATASLHDVIRCLPHGMRGEACTRKIGIIAKRPQTQVPQGPQGYEVREKSARLPSLVKFSLDVHPLETLLTIKTKVASYCQSPLASVKPIQINGRSLAGNQAYTETSHLNLGTVGDGVVADELGIVQGCEMVFVIAERPNQSAPSLLSQSSRTSSRDLSHVFFGADPTFVNDLFELLMGLLELLSAKSSTMMSDGQVDATNAAYRLVWDLLLAMPTNAQIAGRVRAIEDRNLNDHVSMKDGDDMEVDSTSDSWAHLLDNGSFDRSIYALLTVDAFLEPSVEAVSVLDSRFRRRVEEQLLQQSSPFRKAFIESGGFQAVANFFSSGAENDKGTAMGARRGNAVCLRILKACLFVETPETAPPLSDAPTAISDSKPSQRAPLTSSIDMSSQLLQSLANPEGLLKSLSTLVVSDPGISPSTILDVLRFLALLFKSPRAVESFVSMSGSMPQQLLIALLWWDDDVGAKTTSSISTAVHIRQKARDLVLETAELAEKVYPWLIEAIGRVDVLWDDKAAELFDVLEKAICRPPSTETARVIDDTLDELGSVVCRKIAACPRPTNESEVVDVSTVVLCGCLSLLRAMIERAGSNCLRSGIDDLLDRFGIEKRWSQAMSVNDSLPRPLDPSSSDGILIDLIGVVFDGMLSPTGSSTVAVCCDHDSRSRGFDVVMASARACVGGDGYMALAQRIGDLVDSAVPHIRHRWGQFGNGVESHSRTGRGTSKYSGLRNQGCTCYMNSVLQQLFMMNDLRDSLCSAPLPIRLRSVGGVNTADGAELVGKRLQLSWENGIAHDANVEKFDAATMMHTIRYCPIQIATAANHANNHQEAQAAQLELLPPALPDEFVLSEGRPGRETGAFEVVSNAELPVTDGLGDEAAGRTDIEESEDEATSRKLLEEVQRTFVHLQSGAKGRCYDPRALVEACACLKLEFDVWQQNDASEFATKLLDRLEISLKRWAPEHFRYLDHTFGLKQTKQKICKECGMKTSREEKLMNIDCQIRGKADIHEALAEMTEDEIMEGSNKVYCETCKKNTDTVLRTALSTLPNMLILSLKRFDLDYNTFETVKLNSRCAFGDTLNLKRYTLEGLEESEKLAGEENDATAMEADSERGPSGLDSSYEYRLAGVLVHAGVAQGGHYYSFIKDRNPGSEEKWYRFDDEDVTPFDPGAIENECFGGKVKKETKWPNGQVHTVEQEQFANALMLFYEKFLPADLPSDAKGTNRAPLTHNLPESNGYQVFEPDVARANAMYRWQSFLFDADFQRFMKGLLGYCRPQAGMNVTDSNQVDAAWRAYMVNTLVSFTFDAFLYSANRSSFIEWGQELEDTLAADPDIAAMFVRIVARRTVLVSGNWLRTYLMDCPDQDTRVLCAGVFASALKSVTAIHKEVALLEQWRTAWSEQMATIESKFRETGASGRLPSCLGAPFAYLEDAARVDDSASSIGIIFAEIGRLVEFLPRCWRMYGEVGLLLRLLASQTAPDGPIHPALIAVNLPARLMALVVRNRAPSLVRRALPGETAPQELISSQTRAETNTSNVMNMNGPSGLNTNDMSGPRGLMAPDYISIFEALALLGRLPGLPAASLVCESEDQSRGRQRFRLTDAAENALTLLFKECCQPGALGMGARELEHYIQRCGVEVGALSGHKISDLARYPSIDNHGHHLGPESYLAFYQDASQSSDVRVRMDLHTFGFRLDLSRRSENARKRHHGDGVVDRLSFESVAIDVAESFKSGRMSLGLLAQEMLSTTNNFVALVSDFSSPLAEYFVAGATYNNAACESLLVHTLHMLFRAPNDWNGNSAVAANVSILSMLAAVPDEHQNVRLDTLMLSKVKPGRMDHSIGLLEVCRTYQRLRSTQDFHSDAHWVFERYVSVIKELQLVPAVYQWLADHRDQWSFIERELLHNKLGFGHHGRTDYRLQGTDHANPMLPQRSHLDSDMGGMHDSEEDDSYNELFDTEEPNEITISGAGNSAVVGTYKRVGDFEKAIRYSRKGVWKGRETTFEIFQCNVSNNTKHWYISIVPHGMTPGTSNDIDFYSAPVGDTHFRIPPRQGWVKTNEGIDPGPVLVYTLEEADDSSEEDAGAPDNGMNPGNLSVIEPDDQDDSQNPYV